MFLAAAPLHRAWALQQGNITQIVHKAVPAEAVTVTPSAAAAGSTLQVAATLTGFSLLGPTGQVNYTLTPSDGSAPITFSAPLVDGVATGTAIAPTGPVGYTVAAVYAGDNNYLQQTASATGTLATVTFSISPGSSATGTATSSEAVTYGFNLSPLGGSIYPDEITFSASGLPSGYTATFTPPAIPAGSSTTSVTLSIQPPAAQAHNRRPLPGSPVASVALSLMLLPLLGWKQVRRRAPLVLAVLVLSLGTTLGLSGCGSGNGGVSYTIVVTATDTATGAHVSTNVTYIVP